MNEKIKTGGSAFPKNYGIPNEGMTLRDYFAAKAMQGLLISSSEYGIEEQDCAKYAYQYADAMLAERECGK